MIAYKWSVYIHEATSFKITDFTATSTRRNGKSYPKILISGTMNTTFVERSKTRPPSTTVSGTSSYDSASMVGDPEVDMEDENPPVYVPNALGRALVVGFGRFLYVVNSVRFGHTFMVADSIHKDVEGAMRQMKKMYDF